MDARALNEEELRKARELIKNRPLGGQLFGEYEPTIELAEDDDLAERA